DTARHFAASSLAFLGRLAELTRRRPVLVREAEERGDRYGATNLRLGHEHLDWMVRDQVDEGRRDAAAAIEGWSQEGFHIPHFYELLASGQFDLYAGEPERCEA